MTKKPRPEPAALAFDCSGQGRHPRLGWACPKGGSALGRDGTSLLAPPTPGIDAENSGVSNVVDPVSVGDLSQSSSNPASKKRKTKATTTPEN